MEYRLTEEQLTSIITESTKRILSEAIENEGIGSDIMQGLGSAIGKIKQHVGNWGDSFRQGYHQYYNGGGIGDDNQEQNQILQRLSTELEGLKQKVASLEQAQQIQENKNKRK